MGNAREMVRLQGDTGNSTVTIVMIDHPDNPGYPTFLASHADMDCSLPIRLVELSSSRSSSP